ncbi:PREDICTED: uncharacterized protein LOC104600305 [Nelumbo nucifera]|uniref:Uncharacterized protein LOC104600305 n=1 Tax=Nelumbo nucifera TaxID=4432 RepID=A0A1U8AGF9_NELNU|nr:PREDICTED: uncharacterized protein LOC104600305 [Nelumbo nucifera]
MMELHENLQTLIERAWTLHDRITDEIENSCTSLRGFCSQHGYYGGLAVAEAPVVVKQKLIATRDALKVVENMLMFLQRLQSRQKEDRRVAFTRLEESRLSLIKRATEHPGKPLDVIQEMLALFGDENSTFHWNTITSSTRKGKPTVERCETRSGIASYFISWVHILLNPWKWKKAARFGVRFLFLTTTILWITRLHQTRQQVSCSWKKRDYFIADSAEMKKWVSYQEISNRPLDVFHGRG